MSDHADVAGWMEQNPARSRKEGSAAIWFPSSVALYPQELVELGVGLACGALAADGIK